MSDTTTATATTDTSTDSPTTTRATSPTTTAEPTTTTDETTTEDTTTEETTTEDTTTEETTTTQDTTTTSREPTTTEATTTFTSDTTSQDQTTTEDTSTSTSSTRSSSTTSYSVSTDPGGDTVTQTVVVPVTPTLTQSPTTSSGASDGNHSSAFFDNKGAVAGVFTVVGLVVVALIFLAVSIILKRRRAKRFDKEVEKAAAEAAMASAPQFDDEDYDYPASSTGPSAGTQPYSDVSSHGTYQQQPLAVPPESYNMQDIPAQGGYYNNLGGGAYADNPYAAAGAAGAAGIGVRRTLSGAGSPDAHEPYAAFSGPEYYQHQQQYQGPEYGQQVHQPQPEYAAQAPPNPEAAYGAYGAPVAEPQGRQRTQSTAGARSMLDHGPDPSPQSHSGESYAAHYEAGAKPTHSETSDLPNPFAASTPSEEESDDESDDEQQRPKVLKVANE